MKKANKSLSLFLVFVLIFSSSVICSFAESVEDVDYMVHSAEYYFQDVEEPLCFENVNGSDFVYIVVDNEAVLLSFTTNFKGPEMSVFTLPTVLGGYPVTTIGYEYKQGRGYDVSWYIHHGKDFFDEYPEYTDYPDWDPGLKYVSHFVIPEGYKKICDESLLGVRCQISFPKSLREIRGYMFEELYTHIGDNNVKYTVLPECEYIRTGYKALYIAFCVYSPIYFPSRVTSETSAEMLIRELNYGDIYLPSNFSSSVIRDTLFVYAPNPEDPNGDRIWQGDEDVNNNYGKNTTIHCSPDSDFLKVFREITYHNYYTIITDVTPAEYIQFPEETVNIHVGDVVDLEAKTYPTEAIWTACDYEVSDPSIVKIDEYSGCITALKEGTVTVTATHCERGFVDTCTVNVVPEPVPGVNEIKPATDTPYYAYGNRDYTLDVTGSPSKIQVVRDNGGTTTIDRRRAKVTSNGETETWVVNMRVEAGTHNIRAKYGNKWDERLTPFTVTYDTPPTPKAYSFDLGYKNGLGTFEVVTDPQIIKVQFVLDNGCTLTYSQGNSYVAEDGLRHWVIARKIPANTNYTLKTKLGYVWTTTELTVNS